MKAIVWTAYGPPDVLKLKEVETPTPKDNEVLVRIHAAAVTAGDCEQRSLKLPFLLSLPMRMYVGFNKPKRITILGMDLAGAIESVGKDVKRFKRGDQIFATTGIVNMGTYAEYICLPEEDDEVALAMKPVNMTYQEATCVPTGGLEALHFIRQGNIKNGQRIIIIGAGGTIGTFAVQLAKYYGVEVTAVDSAEKLDMLRSIGADKVIDYTKEDFTKSDKSYDVVFDVAGKSSFTRSIRILQQNGRYLIANPRLSQMLRGRFTSMTSSKKVILGAANQTTENLLFLKELIEQGKIKSVVDRTYPLEQIVEAHKYVETGRKKGHVVITVAS